MSPRQCQRAKAPVHRLPIAQVEGPDLEVDPDRRQEALGEHVVRESQQEAALPHRRVPNQQQFEEVVVILLEAHGRILYTFE